MGVGVDVEDPGKDGTAGRMACEWRLGEHVANFLRGLEQKRMTWQKGR